MLVQARSPPLPPRLHHRNPVHVLHQLDPPEGASNRDVCIDIAGIDPDSEAGLDEYGVEPVAGVRVHLVIVGHDVIAHLVFSEIHVQVHLHGRLVEEVVDPLDILTTLRILQIFPHISPSTLDELGRRGRGYLLVVARLIDIIDHSLRSVKFFILDSPQPLALRGVIPEGASPSNPGIILIDDVGVVVEVLVLVDRHAVLTVRRRLVALTGISTGIPHQNSPQIDLDLSARQLVPLQDLISEVGHIDPRIALTRYIEIVLFEIGELPEEISQSPIVILRCGRVVIGKVVVPKTFAEPHTARRLQV